MREISTENIKVGEHILIDGVEYVAEESIETNCEPCAFNLSGKCGAIPCNNLIFKKVEKDFQDRYNVIYHLEGTIQTDGDYIIDFKSMSKNFYDEDFSKYIRECDELYFIDMKTEDAYLVRNFLEQLVRSFRIGTHIFLVKDFYEFINKILDNIFNDKSFVESYMYGNWDSYLFLNKISEEKE